MMKNIRFQTIAVLFAKLPTPRGNRCLHVDMRFSTFDIGSHVISCFREFVIRAEHCELHNNNGVRTTLLTLILFNIYVDADDLLKPFPFVIDLQN